MHTDRSERIATDDNGNIARIGNGIDSSMNIGNTTDSKRAVAADGVFAW